MEKQAGVVVVLSKSGDQGVKVPLKTNTPCSLGSSLNATIRVFIDNQNLRDIHCVINVNAKGFAVLVNKSRFHPVVLNGRSLLNEKVLINNDIFEVCGRKFQYVNSRMTEEKAKLYKKETGVLLMPTPLKSRVTESVASAKKFATPRRSIMKKQIMSTTKQSKKVSPRGSKSATKPKLNYSPVQTRRSLFKSKISASTSKIPVKSVISPRAVKATSTPKIFSRSSAAPDRFSGSSRKSKTPFSTPKTETSVESFLRNESLFKSAKRSSRSNSLRRFVTVRGLRRKPSNLSFDSSSAEEETPSKRNVSGDDVETTLFNTSKRRSFKSQNNASLNETEAETSAMTPSTAHMTNDGSRFNYSKRKSVKSFVHGSTTKLRENLGLNDNEAQPLTPHVKYEAEGSARSSRKSSIRAKANGTATKQLTPHLKYEEETSAAVTDAASKRRSVRSSLRGSTIASMGNTSSDDVEAQPPTPHLTDEVETSVVETILTPEFNTSKRKSVRSSLRGSTIASIGNTSSDDVEAQPLTPYLTDEAETSAAETIPTPEINISKRKSVRSSLRGSTIASIGNTSSDDVEAQPLTPYVTDEAETSAAETASTPEFNISKRKSVRSSLRGSTIAAIKNISTDDVEAKPPTPRLKVEDAVSTGRIDATFELNTSKRRSVRSSLRGSTIASIGNTSSDDVEAQPLTPHLRDEAETSAAETVNTPEFNISKRKSVRSSLRGSTIAAMKNISTGDVEAKPPTPRLKDEDEASAARIDATFELNTSKRRSVKSSLRDSTIASIGNTSSDDVETQLLTPHLRDEAETSAAETAPTPEFNISKRKSVRSSLRGSTIAAMRNISTDDVEAKPPTPRLKDEDEVSAARIDATFELNTSKPRSVRSSLRGSTIASIGNTSSDDVEAQLLTPHLRDEAKTSAAETVPTPEFNISKRKSVRSSLRGSTIAAMNNISTDDIEAKPPTPRLKDEDETSAARIDATLEFNTSKRRSVRSSLRGSTIGNTSSDDVEAEPLTPHLKDEEETSVAKINATLEFGTSNRRSVRSSLRGSTIASIENTSSDNVEAQSLTPQQAENLAKSSRSSRARAKSLATEANPLTPVLKDDETLTTTLPNNRVRPKSLTGRKPKSSRKRYSVHAVSSVSRKIHSVEGNAEEVDVTTPVMTHNISKNCLSAPRIHHMRKSRLDDAVNESLHMDDSGLETPVIHEVSRRSLAKKSTAKLQESLRHSSPDTSLDIDEMQNTTPDVENSSRRFSGDDILSTPLKAGESNSSIKSARKLSNMKVSITSTPKEPTPSRGVKRQLSTSLNEVDFRNTKILRRSSRSVTDENSKQNGTPLAVLHRSSRKSASVNAFAKLRTNLTGQENFISDDSSLLESTVASSIVYETNLSKIKMRTPLTEKKELQKTPSSSENVNTPKSDLSNISGIGSLYASPGAHTNQSTEINIPEVAYTANYAATSSFKVNISTDQGVKSRTQTRKKQKSPENDLRNIRGLRRLMQTPRDVKSPENDLRSVRVRNLMQSPKGQKSPENDLRGVRGVRTLMQTPKRMKSPENDLRNVGGLRRLMETPQQMKSPQNDLSDVRGLRKLMQTPKEQKSPENDLRDVRGVKTLLRTPKQMKSPENDLRNVSGLGILLQTPVVQNSTETDVTDVRRRKQAKSPNNDLRNVGGLKRLMRTPKEIKPPKNDLSNVSGVKRLMREESEPNNDLRNVSGVRYLFEREEESAFDRLVEKKKIITYKRKISSPEAKKDYASPTTVNADVTPRVQEWVSEQILQNEETLERESGETKEVEQPPSKKRVTRRARAADGLDPVVITTTRSTRQRTMAVEEPKEEEKKTVRATRRNAKQVKEQSEVESVEVTPVQTSRRKRQLVAVDTDESTTQNKAESVKRSRRQNKKEADEKLKTNNETPIKEQIVPAEEPFPTSMQQQKPTRGRKQSNRKQVANESESPLINAKTLENQQEESLDIPIEQQRQTRGRRQNNSKHSEDKPEKPLIKKQQESFDTPVQPQRQTRGRRQNNSKEAGNASEKVLVNANTLEKPEKSPVQQQKQTRGRKQNNNKQTENANISEKQQEKSFSAERKQTRSRKQTGKENGKSVLKTNAVEKAQESPKAKRQNKKKRDSDTEESVDTPVEKTKRTRARGAKETPSLSKDDNDDTSTINEETKTTRVTRRARKVEVEDQPSPLRRSARTRRK